MTELLQDAIDPECTMATLNRWLETGEDKPTREFLAPALHHLACGHVRPSNLRVDPDEVIHCTICGPMRVVSTEMLPEPEWFPHPVGLSDLPTPE